MAQIRINTGSNKLRINQPGGAPIAVNPVPDPPEILLTSADQVELIPLEAQLTIPTYDADVRCTHPDVIYIPGGWNGYTYWMLFTPYPAEARENPSIVASNDGDTWVVPAGLTNPIEAAPAGTPGNYNSDTDLVYIESESKMYAFWRYADGVNTLYYYRTSTDGITWGGKTLIFTYTDPQASPAFIYKDEAWHMWYVNVITEPYKVVYRTASTLAGIQAASDVDCTIGTIPSGYHIWHIDVRYDTRTEKYFGLFCYTLIPGEGGSPNNGGKLLSAISSNKTTWTPKSSFFKESQSAYRATFCQSAYSDAQGALYDAFYTIQWRIKRSLIFISDTPSSDMPFQSIATNITSFYWLYCGLNAHHLRPTAMVIRSSDSAITHVFPNSGNTDLLAADGTDLTTWKGAATLTVLRLYDQAYAGDYMLFTTGPVLSKSYDGNWALTFNGSDNYGDTYTATNTIKAVTMACNITSGAPFSVKSGSQYFGINTGTSLVLSNSGTITATNDSNNNVWTGKPGASGFIRKNGTQVATGSNTAFSGGNVKYTIGAQWAVSSYSRPFSGILYCLIGWADAAATGDYSSAETILL